MSLASIYAILALLSAFGVSQPTVDTVQSILLAQQTPATLDARVAIGGPSAVIQDCSPLVEGSVVWTGGTIDTGSEYMFNATSTYPTDCQINRSTNVTLQTPSVTYKGTIGSWAENGNGRTTQNQFIYHQGFGFPIGKKSTGDFTLTIGDSVTRVPLP